LRFKPQRGEHTVDLLLDPLRERSPFAPTHVELVPRTPDRSGVAPVDGTLERFRIDNPHTPWRDEDVVDVSARARHLAVMKRYDGVAELLLDERRKAELAVTAFAPGRGDLSLGHVLGHRSRLRAVACVHPFDAACHAALTLSCCRCAGYVRDLAFCACETGRPLALGGLAVPPGLCACRQRRLAHGALRRIAQAQASS